MGLPEIEAQQAARRKEAQEAIKSGLNPMRSAKPGPRIFSDRGIYVVAWDEPEQVQFDFDLLTTERSGETTAELTIYTTGATDLRSLHRTRINLLSTISQERLAKHLAPRTKHLALNWTELIDQACQAVVAMYRAGEPAILLRDAPRPAFGASLLPPILAADGATILFGDGGTGKSMIALAMAASIHSGSALLGGLGVTSTKRVGYCDWEWEAHVHRQRLEKMWGDVDLPDIMYVPCRLSLSDERDRLRRIVMEHKLEFLVLDSVALAAGGEPESAEVAIKFFSALRALGVPTLLVAHVTNAAAKTSADRPFGSAFWNNSARSTWYAKKGEGSSDKRLVVGLYNRKVNDGPIAAPIGLTLEFGEELTLIKRSDVRDEADLDQVRSIRYRIRDELQGGPAPVEALVERLDEPADSIRAALRRGEHKDFIRVVRDGMNQWGLMDSSYHD